MKSCLDEADGCYVMMVMTVSWRKERSRIEWSELDEKSHQGKSSRNQTPRAVSVTTTDTDNCLMFVLVTSCLVGVSTQGWKLDEDQMRSDAAAAADGRSPNGPIPTASDRPFPAN